MDAKLLRGGLVDLEFLVHYLQLRHREALVPHLGEAIAQLVAADHLAPALVDAHGLMTRLLVGTRLLAPELERPGAAAATLLARQSGCGDYDDLTRCLRAARENVAAAWHDVFGEKLEMD